MPEWLKEVLELGEVHRYQYFVESHHHSVVFVYHNPTKIELLQKIADRFVKAPFKLEVKVWDKDTAPFIQSIGRQNRL